MYNEEDFVNLEGEAKQNVYSDSANILWGFLAFFFPILGLFFYILWWKYKPILSSRLLGGFIAQLICKIILGIAVIAFLVCLILRGETLGSVHVNLNMSTTQG